MKTNRLAVALAISAIPLLTGCGSSGNSSGDIPASGYTTQCTPSGCIQVPINGGCIPLSQPIYFAGSNTQIYYPGVIQAGQIPYGGTYGTMSVSASAISSSGGYTVSSVSAGSQMNMSIYSGGYGSTTASISGGLQLSALIQQQIAYYNQGIGSYTGANGYLPWAASPGYYGTNSVCVSGIAIQGYLYQTVPAFQGNVYLYLNNTQHGWALPMY
jgi:hypothetical protein